MTKLSFYIEEKAFPLDDLSILTLVCENKGLGENQPVIPGVPFVR